MKKYLESHTWRDIAFDVIMFGMAIGLVVVALMK